jgi:ferrous iron transport protein A
MTLKDLQVGERAKVAGYLEGGGAYRRKLLAMGLTPGAELAVVRVAPMGDPVEIRLRGYALTLRREEAAGLVVERL